MLMENGKHGDTRIKNELSKKLDVYPSDLMTRKTFIYRIVADLCLTGNKVVIPKVNDDLIENLILCPTGRVSFTSKTDTSYKISYDKQIFDPDEVLHFVLNPDSNYQYIGTGFTPLVKKTVENILQANATKTAFLKSKWKPSMIVSIAADVEELRDPVKRNKILGSYTETTEEGEPWLIPSGEIDVKTISPLTLNDLAIQDSITLDIRSIASAFGVPPFLVGVGDFNKNAYNNFISRTIMSVAIAIQQELTRKILYSPALYWKFNPKSLMQYSLDEQNSYVKNMVGGGLMTRNEGRNDFDLSPVDDEGMNEFIVLENFIPVSKVGDQKKLDNLKQKGDEEDA